MMSRNTGQNWSVGTAARGTCARIPKTTARRSRGSPKEVGSI